MTETPRLVYFSSASENTKRFVDKLGIPALRIPLYPKRDGMLRVSAPYVLIVPTYGGGSIKGAIPVQVRKFLNVEANRALLRGVITAGNRNFGTAYCIAGPMISRKCGVPELYRFELLGTEHDVARVRSGLKEFFASDAFIRHAEPAEQH
ncbi:class Ib ribonucleoside-diphosphate reductase assembly flavoprotein NrdI [Corynebacterium liangguodongii]|uniref:Protein NrdI n=1 Tax=Corynebacterium liangguodongii TaxID=2079535 RepID=A0A2S0WBQ5_9CORY|nr:class Ib ribonucleoside-diphosphate reductase assembly flavoprotein NrdI [Corynebacterium liangguodongii]AWB83184.1 class Ib ribonucleoside-diphosphate reductase assembly flavoprotein NrdI [Corynebacterium liangguodongii]PWB98779.1 class Ib ribonucleoside-diphosphate reductase assembly flavoprotein NrdI [Corynebacterium liangguodongii]